MIRRCIFRRAARGLVVAMIFAQVAVTANACLAASAARVAAVASASHEGCEMQERNLNLCLYHCADQYSGGAQEIPVFPPALAALPVPAAGATGMAPTEAWAIVTRATGPPLSIRHCCLRI